MIELLSIVSFRTPGRIQYLERALNSFQGFYDKSQLRHIIIDGSDSLCEQKDLYERYNIEYYFDNSQYSARLKRGIKLLNEDYFIFFPDDYEWIFPFPIGKAIKQCRKHKIAILKLACRGMKWFSSKNPEPKPWFHNGKVCSGEQLKKHDDLWVSDCRLLRDFHEQFSLGCHLNNTAFMRKTCCKMPDNLPSPGKVEISAYKRLFLRKYRVGYYKMWIPAFHFIDLKKDPADKADRGEDMLICQNHELYNRLYNCEPNIRGF